MELDRENAEKKIELIRENAEKRKAGIDVRLDEHKSYINNDTGEIFLRSDGYRPDKKSSAISTSEEWIIREKAVVINEAQQSSKTVPMSQLSGIKLNKQFDMNFLHLYIAGGTTSRTFFGTGGISGMANYSITFSDHDLEVAQKAHDYIAAQISK
jgi:hypothetical protein